MASKLYDIDTVPRRGHANLPNAFVGAYLSRDGRHVYLAAVHVSDDTWAALCNRVCREGLLHDRSLCVIRGPAPNRSELVTEPDDLFGTRTVAEGSEVLTSSGIALAKVQTARELHNDCQVTADHYVQDVKAADGGTYTAVASAVRFNDSTPDRSRSPRPGEDTDEVLAEYGFDPSSILEMKIDGTLW